MSHKFHAALSDSNQQPTVYLMFTRHNVVVFYMFLCYVTDPEFYLKVGLDYSLGSFIIDVLCLIEISVVHYTFFVYILFTF